MNNEGHNEVEDGILELSSCQKLEKLTLSHCGLKKQVCKLPSVFPNLQQLHLDHNYVGDEIEFLFEFKSIAHVNLQRTRMTELGVRRLEKGGFDKLSRMRKL